MTTHPTIAALKAALESERDELIANRESWLLECSCDPSSEFYDGGTCYYHLSESEKHKQNFNAGHEAATERLMTIVEKAVEMSDNIEHILKYADREFGWLELIDSSNKEFLTTLADASGEIKLVLVKKEIK